MCKLAITFGSQLAEHLTTNEKIKKMQVKAVYKYARISAFKAREVTREIQGKPVSMALDILAFTPLKAAALIDKTLRSAVANAENNNGMSADDLTVQKAVVGEGPTLKRWRARARGGAGPIHKRTSHISITLTDEVPIPQPRKRKSASARKKARPTAASVPRSEENAKAAAASAASEPSTPEPAAPVSAQAAPATADSTETTKD